MGNMDLILVLQEWLVNMGRELLLSVLSLIVDQQLILQDVPTEDLSGCLDPYLDFDKGLLIHLQRVLS